MLRTAISLMIAAISLTTFSLTAQAEDVTLLTTPAVVAATFNALDEGGYAAQIGVHNGPITQLVHTIVRADSAANVQRALRKQVQWLAPYLFVHSSCGGGRALRCEGEAVFKVVEGTAFRLGDVIGSVPTIYSRGHFVDQYDKLDGQLGAAVLVTPSFTLVLDDAGGKLTVNAAATWDSNVEQRRLHTELLANTKPSNASGELNPQYLTALTSNAALARYCNRNEELQALLDVEKLALTADQFRVVTDALSLVVPLELPKAWRKPY
jgi:hypothetical protein